MRAWTLTALLLACNGPEPTPLELDDSGDVQGVAPAVGTWRAVFEGEFEACSIGAAADRIRALRQQIVFEIARSPEEGQNLEVADALGGPLWTCRELPSDGSYDCGQTYVQHDGVDGNAYAHTVVTHAVFDEARHGTVTMEATVECIGSSCPFETCTDTGTYTAAPFEQTEALTRYECALADTLRPTDAHTETLLEVVNGFGTPVELVWVDWTGVQRPQTSVPASTTATQRAFAGHPWILQDGSGTCIGVYQLGSDIGVVELP